MAPSHYFGLGRKAIDAGDIDLDGATIVAILCDNTYIPAQDTDEFVADLTGEVVDASYSRVTLTSKVVSYDGASNAVKWTCDPIDFAGLAATFRFMVLAVSTGSDATSRLIKWTDFEADQTATAGATITPDATNGLAVVTVA